MENQKTVVAKASLWGVVLASVAGVSPVSFAQLCEREDPVEIRLYFPTASGTYVGIKAPSYRDEIVGGMTEPFHASNLDFDPALVSDDDLIRSISDLIRKDFEEFDVVVTTSRDPFEHPEPRSGTRTAVICTDSKAVEITGGGCGHLIGYGHNTGPSGYLGWPDVGYARIWAASLTEVPPTTPCAAGTPPCRSWLIGTHHTLANWTRAIGSTLAHEIGHSFELGHCEARGGPGGDTDHIMAPSTFKCMGTTTAGLTCDDRVDKRRYFSDTSYGIIGSKTGLAVHTMHNWDFVNTNSTEAVEFSIDFVSPSLSLDTLWSYEGADCPWGPPTLTSTGLTTFRGRSYPSYRVTWRDPRPWSGGTSGRVPGGGKFHVGVSFVQKAPVIPTLVRFWEKDASGALVELSDHPRFVAYDDAALTASAPCLFELTLYNPGNSVLRIADFHVRFLPRLPSLESLVESQILSPLDRAGRPITRHDRFKLPNDILLAGGSSVQVPLAALSDDRFIDIAAKVEPSDDEGHYFVGNRLLGPFPATVTYVTAEIHDIETESVSRMYYTISGHVPDCNCNGRDDKLEIADGSLADANANGMPDICEREFIRGDSNGDGTPNLSDALYTLDWMFGFSGAPIFPDCFDALDSSDQGSINISSPVYLLNYLFSSGPAPPAPFPGCGQDLTLDILDCNRLSCP